MAKNHCPVYWSWDFLRPGPDPMRQVHLCYNRETWRSRSTAGRKLRAVGRMALWPVRAAVLTRRSTRRYGDAVRRRTGKGIARQALEQMILVLRHSMPPDSYYRYQLFESDKRRDANQYAHEYQCIPIFFARIPDAAPRYALDKRWFAAFCVEHGFPSPPILARFEGGAMLKEVNASRGRVTGDLVFKPAFGKAGHDVAIHRKLEGDRYVDAAGETRTAAALFEFYENLSRQAPYILQARIENHPEIADLTTGATARIVTGRPPGARAEFVIASFKLPVGASDVDNFAAGGIASPIDEATGVLGPAIAKDLAASWCERHPDTGVAISGRRLPFWTEAVDLVLRAHEALPEPALLGWDVALTPEGPSLLETNRGWSFDLVQRPHGRPIGKTRFPEIYLSHLRDRTVNRASTS